VFEVFIFTTSYPIKLISLVFESILIQPFDIINKKIPMLSHRCILHYQQVC